MGESKPLHNRVCAYFLLNSSDIEDVGYQKFELILIIQSRI